MRTIKFRGKRVDTGEWVYGYYVYQNNSHEIFIEDTSKDIFVSFHVNPETVGEFTGLHDKDGNEIYEGDVLKLHKTHDDYSQYFWEVFYDDGAFQVKTFKLVGRTPLTNHILQAFQKDVIEEFSDCPSLFEVIGNIHDNPELIKEDNP